MDRADDILIPAQTSWLNDPDAQAVCAAIAGNGHQILFVGGCVRNALLGLPDSDIDLATSALPEQVMQIALDAGFKAVPTGIDHGTVTVVVGGKGFEVTTLRRDVETDGRRAVVAFSTDIADDARRRDFTMNALYATPEGRVLDPLGGMADLRARRVRFIEDAAARIREDYLRILRFFRFSTWYADLSEGFEAETLNAIASNLDGLETLSAERVGAEMQKILAAPDPAQVLAAMRQIGVLQTLLPAADDRWIGMIVHFESDLGLAPDWHLRLAALGGDDVPSRLRLSKQDARELSLLQEAAYGPASLPEITYRQGTRIATGAAMLRSAMSEMPLEASTIETIIRASGATFPIAATDLMPTYVGAALGARLAALERRWIDSDFQLDRETLLAIPDS
jgi:poly(A) polymerase/tRNA nucleotidyltransferase (CCA-adding enzyme)